MVGPTSNLLRLSEVNLGFLVNLTLENVRGRRNLGRVHTFFCINSKLGEKFKQGRKGEATI